MLSTLAVDYQQTMDIKNHPGMYERNPLLGEHPSDARIRNYFTLAAIGSVAAVYLMPSEYRKYFIGGVLTLELITIGQNRGIGLRTNF